MIFAVLGLLMMMVGALMLQKAVKSHSWPKTEGVIIESHIRMDDYRARDITPYFSPVVAYSYVVAKRGYTGKNISPADFGGSERQAKNIINRYPVNKNVYVYYDPADPNNAVLEPGLKLFVVIPFLGGMLLFSIAIFSMFHI